MSPKLYNVECCGEYGWIVASDPDAARACWIDNVGGEPDASCCGVDVEEVDTGEAGALTVWHDVPPTDEEIAEYEAAGAIFEPGPALSSYLHGVRMTPAQWLALGAGYVERTGAPCVLWATVF